MVNPPWRTPAVLGLAEQLETDKESGLARILADALEEAGGPDWLIDHLRHGEREHFSMGCIYVRDVVRSAENLHLW